MTNIKTRQLHYLGSQQLFIRAWELYRIMVRRLSSQLPYFCILIEAQ